MDFCLKTFSNMDFPSCKGAQVLMGVAGEGEVQRQPIVRLQNITKRVESPDFDLVATAYSIHRTVGGNLAEILDNIAYTIRERVRIKGEIATLTAQARASGTLITFLPIVLAVFMYFVTPTYFRPMFQNFIGWILIAIGAFMIFIGNLIIRRVVAIEV